MSEDEPRYGSYTLGELHDALRSLDRNRYPERLRLLKSEISRREADSPAGVPIDEPSNLGPWQRRAVAFIFDLILIGATWTVIDNLLFIPLPRILNLFGYGLIFFGYFASTEAFGGVSHGKRALGVVIRGRYGGVPTPGRAAIRAGVVTAIVALKWEQVLPSLGVFSVSIFMVYLIWAMRLSILWVNASLGITSPQGRTIQDLVSDTAVASTHLDQSERVRERAPTGRSPATQVLVAVVVAAMVFAVVFGLWPFLRSAGGFPIDLAASSERWDKLPHTIEEWVAEETGIRTRIAINEMRRWGTGHDGSRELLVSVWIPAIRWTETSRKRVAEAALSHLQVTPGSYEEGKLKLWTGGMPLTVSRLVPLTLPDADYPSNL